MKRLAAIAVLLTLLLPNRAGAHIGSPDVFYEGAAGPYPVSVTIRMPGVVPGRAEIYVQARASAPVAVSFAPIASATAISNTPPAEAAQTVPGQTNVFTGELWLMTSGAYSIDIRVRGAAGEGDVQVPVNSVAIRRLGLPPYLGAALAVLAAVLILGGISIAAAAAGESTQLAGISRRRYWTAATVAATIFFVLTVVGKNWIQETQDEFESRLHDGGWPDVEAKVKIRGGERILKLKLGKSALSRKRELELVPDHGKMLHIYLIRLPDHSAFAHIHPVNQDDRDFEAVIPPALPEGDYETLCDAAFSSGFSSTATNSLHVPPAPAGGPDKSATQPDADDSWRTDFAAARDNSPGDTTCMLADGAALIWKGHDSLRARQNAGLRFEVRGPDGKPAALEAYMGMLCHAAVLRADGKVFAHLHPTGNFSMAAQQFFDSKAGQNPLRTHGGSDAFCGAAGGVGGPGTFSLPYEFPTAGNFRLWVQIKTAGQVQTGVFDATVQPPSM